MTHRVCFTVKCTDERSPDFQYIEDRYKLFPTMRSATSFVREIQGRLGQKEVLVGRPLYEEVA